MRLFAAKLVVCFSSFGAALCSEMSAADQLNTCPVFDPEKAANITLSFDYQKSPGAAALPGVVTDRTRIKEIFSDVSIPQFRIGDEGSSEQGVSSMNRTVILSKLREAAKGKSHFIFNYLGHSIAIPPPMGLEGDPLPLNTSKKKSLALVLPGIPSECAELLGQDNVTQVPRKCFEYLVYYEEILADLNPETLLSTLDSCHSGAEVNSVYSNSSTAPRNHSSLHSSSPDQLAAEKEFGRRTLPPKNPEFEHTYRGPRSQEEAEQPYKDLEKEYWQHLKVDNLDRYLSLPVFKRRMSVTLIKYGANVNDLNSLDLLEGKPLAGNDPSDSSSFTLNRKRIELFKKVLEAEQVVRDNRIALTEYRENTEPINEVIAGGHLVDTLYETFKNPSAHDPTPDGQLTWGDLKGRVPENYGTKDYPQNPGSVCSCSGSLLDQLVISRYGTGSLEEKSSPTATPPPPQKNH